ncbi:hypothetical protein ZWY2020_046384 [Hordeum vulgare]|nr:hypothetical protein ZWY2020_046384 [Hordeum vulgare]
MPPDRPPPCPSRHGRRARHHLLPHAFPPALWRLMYRDEVGPEKKMAVARRTIDRFAADTIAKRRSSDDHNHNESSSDDMLSSFLCGNDDASDEFCVTPR